MSHSPWNTVIGDNSLVATALHGGHEVRNEVAARLAIGECDRLREEDPGTGEWTAIAGTRIVVQHSRFEVDLNRPRSKAVYLRPEDAWGLTVWREPPPDAQMMARSLDIYDAFYAEIRTVLESVIRRHGSFVLLDLHAYNHRRGGPGAPVADLSGNPEADVEIDERSRKRWSSLVEGFIGDLRTFDFPDHRLDVRENVRFQPGHFACWVNDNFSDFGCCLAVEFKKCYMDEWSGVIDTERHAAISAALESTVPGLLEELAHPS
jgi:N-formylglutamate deformylase